MSAAERPVGPVELYRLRLPLRTPYRLSFATLDDFELFLARVWLGGDSGVGESVPLAVYSTETAEDVWSALRESVRAIAGRPAGEALATLERSRERRPFATAPLMTALETALAPPVPSEDLAVPLLGTVLSHDEDRSPEEIEALLGAGYRTLKVKVGFDVAADVRWVARVQELVDGRARIRVDANQGYSFEAAREFVGCVEPEGIEVFEQPFDPGEWDAMARLAALSPLPLMLDESIATAADLERLIELGCAGTVKFKLAKAGGLAALERLIARARDAGLQVVLGNGVAGDVGNLHELVVAARAIATAGEMNGFLKPSRRLLTNPYEVVDGSARLPRGYVADVDWERVEAHAVNRLDVALAATAS